MEEESLPTSPASAASPTSPSVKVIFERFATGPDMDGRQFVKLCRDAKLFDTKFTTTDADLIFARVKTKGQRKIHLADFKRALTSIADKRSTTTDMLVEKIGAVEGPVYVGTKAEAVRFYGDRGHLPHTAAGVGRKIRTQAPVV
eukprot:GHVO01049459.1.p1 GENE.GHVO01049459.1~~GHVO01049459.1.p1  ORF type:complete len:152 (+),score=27.80 GHVO01049459.1:25-456(+)